MHENEVFVAEVLGEPVFQQQWPASGSHHQKDASFPKTLKPRSQQDTWQRENGHRETLTSPPHNSFLVTAKHHSGKRCWRGRWGSTNLKLQCQTTALVSPLGTCCQVLACTAASSLCMFLQALTISLFRLKSHRGIGCLLQLLTNWILEKLSTSPLKK